VGIYRYTVRRLLQAIPVLLGIITITFLLSDAIPGDPVQIMLGPSPSQAQIEAIRAKYGLNQPLYVRYGNYVWGLLQGDMGQSLYYQVPVLTKIKQRLPATLLLLISSFVFAIVTAVPLGVISAKRRNKPTDHISRVVALVGVSTPSFWIGLMMILIFVYNLGWFDSTGLVIPWEGPGPLIAPGNQAAAIGAWTDHMVEVFNHLLLPTLSLGTLQMAAITRIERSSMLEVLSEDYVQLARAYGVRERTILRKHAFHNAQLPVITLLGLQITTAIGGAVLTETVFAINGMGTLIVNSIYRQDFPTIMGTTFFYGLVFVIGVILTDISYAYVDPRVSYGEAE
jgi:peptide/nickel transport system permease protein